MEFTDREKCLVHTMKFMMNPLTKAVPIETRAIALKTMLGIRGINISEDECKDMTHAVEQEQNEIVQNGFAFLDKHKESMKGMGDLSKLLKG